MSPTLLLSVGSKGLCYRCKPFSSDPKPLFHSQRSVRANSQSGQPFNEGAAQVKRLINRDKKQFLGNKDDILEKFRSDFEVDNDSQPTPSANPFGSSSTTANPFGSSTPSTSSNPFSSSPSAPSSSSSNPFGSAPAAAPFRPSGLKEPVGLSPSMSPDPVVKEKPFNLLASINMTQIVLFCSFTLIIALMLATFNVVLGTGAIRLAGIE